MSQRIICKFIPLRIRRIIGLFYIERIVDADNESVIYKLIAVDQLLEQRIVFIESFSVLGI